MIDKAGRILNCSCLCGAVRHQVADAPGITPSAHIFVGSKAPWFTITDDMAQYLAFPD